jgi:hypothetical protein
VYSGLPTGSFLLDIILWWLGLSGLTYGGAVLAGKLRLRFVGDVESYEHFPFANLLGDVGTLLIGILLTAAYLPRTLGNGDSGNLILLCMGGILVLFSAASLVMHVTRE